MVNFAVSHCLIVLDDARDLPNGNYAQQGTANTISCTAHISKGTSYGATCEMVRLKIWGICHQQRGTRNGTLQFKLFSCDFRGGPDSMSAPAVAGDHTLKFSPTQDICCIIL